MADYVAGRGTTALGIIGTVLGGLGTVGALNPGVMAASYEGTNACMHDVEIARECAAKDSEIAMLKAEKYADGVREDAKQYGIEIYKDLAARINELKDVQNAKWTDQMVVNANLSNAITTLDGQAKATAGLVAQITRTAVPQSAICNFGGGCGCGNNI